MQSLKSLLSLKTPVEAKASRLLQFSYDNTPEFTLSDRDFYSKILDIYDGDTVTLTVKVNETYYRMNARLHGIDTPEMRSCNEDVKHAAKQARNYLIRLITNANPGLEITRQEIRNICKEVNSILLVKGKGFDKYGRLLVELWKEGDTTSINSQMVSAGYAGVYDGGTKKFWTDYFKPGGVEVASSPAIDASPQVIEVIETKEVMINVPFNEGIEVVDT